VKLALVHRIMASEILSIDLCEAPVPSNLLVKILGLALYRSPNHRIDAHTNLDEAQPKFNDARCRRFLDNDEDRDPCCRAAVAARMNQFIMKEGMRLCRR
jgi:hypothetical protein